MCAEAVQNMHFLPFLGSQHELFYTWNNWADNFLFPYHYLIITESQNHRIVGVGRDLCGSSSPTPLPKQGHLQQAAQELIQAGLEYLQRRRLHNLPGQPVPLLRHPQREEVLPHVQMELSMLQFLLNFATPPLTGHISLIELQNCEITAYLNCCHQKKAPLQTKPPTHQQTSLCPHTSPLLSPAPPRRIHHSLGAGNPSAFTGKTTSLVKGEINHPQPYTCDLSTLLQLVV